MAFDDSIMYARPRPVLAAKLKSRTKQNDYTPAALVVACDDLLAAH